MANLHHEFRTLHRRIALTGGRKATLKHEREMIRNRISKYFLDILQVPAPKFRGQGACAMDTAVNPINGEYDIDDGLYLQHLDPVDRRRWPAPEAVHIWVIDATMVHTGEAPQNKKACVRVGQAGRYHVDLPIYAEFRDKFYLAECGARGWHGSDPLALTYWFLGAIRTHGEQLRRVILYLKAWADFQSSLMGKMPNGLILTVFGVRNFIPDERDDISLAKTLQSMAGDADGLVYVLNPVNIHEELTLRLTGVQKERFQYALGDTVADALKAVAAADALISAALWRKHLGDRFPLEA